jgi:hypothetical protein
MAAKVGASAAGRCGGGIGGVPLEGSGARSTKVLGVTGVEPWPADIGVILTLDRMNANLVGHTIACTTPSASSTVSTVAEYTIACTLVMVSVPMIVHTIWPGVSLAEGSRSTSAMDAVVIFASGPKMRKIGNRIDGCSASVIGIAGKKSKHPKCAGSMTHVSRRTPKS